MKCLIECGREVYARGICLKHYNMILRLVEMGIRTWSEFENVGLVLPPERWPGKRDNPEWMKVIKEKQLAYQRKRYQVMKLTPEGRAKLKRYADNQAWKRRLSSLAKDLATNG